MKLRNILIISLWGFCAATVTAEAQVVLGDKEAQEVDLGFGVKSSEFLTTAATYTITAEELRRTSAISLADALYGKLLGLNAYQNTGFKGEENRGATFNIRGVQTTGETDILILVDGFERPIDRLSVEEVESVTVLRDAAAVAMYGHEGINGVLLVKTKRGVADSGFHFKAGASHKIQYDPYKAPMVGEYPCLPMENAASMYAHALNVARANDGLPAAYTSDEIQKFRDGSDRFVYPNVNWKDEVFKNTASESNGFISMYGGSDKVEYYTQLDYTDARGLYKHPDQGSWNSQLRMSKANIRANVDFQVTSSTRVRTNIFALFMETNGVPNVNSNDAWWHLYKVPALAFPIKTAGGVWGGSQTYGDFNLVAKSQGTGFDKTHQRQIWADLTLEQDLDFVLPGLQFYVGGSYDNASNIIEHRTKGYQYGWNYYVSGKTDPEETVMGTVQDQLTFDYQVDSQWRIGTVFSGLKYAKAFGNGDHFSANAGYNMKSEIRDGRSNTWYRANWTLATHYDHAERFMMDLVLAANGSNRSYPAKWAFSPTLGLGYIFANNPEGFLNYGKVRASAGIQHTDYVPANGLWLAAWNNSHGQFWYGQSFTSSYGAFLTQFPTTDFQQEAAWKANVGTDLRFGNALDFIVDVFYQQRRNILVSAGSLNSDVVGIQSSYDDKGRVASYGAEAGLRYAKTFANGFNLNFGANASFVKSRILEWIETPAFPNLSVIGTPADAARGLIAQGFFGSEAEIASSPLQEFGQVKVGDTKYKDVNEDGVINENDFVAQDWGSTFPALNFGFNLGMEFKGFGINAYFQGAALQTKNLMYVDGVWGALSDNRGLSSEYYNNCYDVIGADALYPRLSTTRVANNVQASTVWFRNVQWLKLRDCEVYYRLPARLLGHVNVSDAKLFVQGQNLLSFDNIPAMDAENLNTGYPVMKAVTMGLSVIF